MSDNNGVVNIRGKNYKTVALRVSEFKEVNPLWSIQTELVDSGDNVVMKAMVLNEDDRIIGTGYAEEVRGSTNINKTSALENCETSAIGRALASCGFAGTEYASAEEVANAISQQSELETHKKMSANTQIILAHLETISTIKQALALDDLETASEAWYELTQEEMQSLWVAPTKGGAFTTKERETMKSTEFRKSHFGETEKETA